LFSKSAGWNIYATDDGQAPKRSREEETKMNKQMTPAEIEAVRQSFVGLPQSSDKTRLIWIESGPWPPPPDIPAAIAPAGMTMK
jgi:hypothetical protein